MRSDFVASLATACKRDAGHRRYAAMTPEQRRAAYLQLRRSWVVAEMMLDHPEMTRDEANAIYDRVEELLRNEGA